jgi:hypothetical protein
MLMGSNGSNKLLLLWVPATLKFNNTTKVFTITVTHDLSAIAGGHIHKGLLEQMERSFSIHYLQLVIQVLLLQNKRPYG